MTVCKTPGVDFAGACDGDTWCTSAAVSANPSCLATVPSVETAGSKNAYFYFRDEHGFAITSGTLETFNVNDVAPVISAISLNGGSAITLTEGTTTNISVAATVTDNNSCTDIDSVETTVYRSGISYAGCDTFR